MKPAAMTSLQRVLTSLGHQEPDRVPLFLLLTMHGARELGISIQEYFSKAENVVEGQMRMRAKFGQDCIYTFFYAPLEVEAWGAEVLYVEDGPPNSAQPFLRTESQIIRLEAPCIQDTVCLHKVLSAIQMLKARVTDQAPIIGVVMSPFSLPVMQMGFDKYLELIYEKPDLFWHLMQVNQEFCVAWANAQLAAGATAICYFDPVSSTTILPREKYLETGFKVARETIARIQGPTATHLASGRALPLLDDLAQTGTAIVGVSALEDLGQLKAVACDKLTLLGNLNGIEMRHWTQEQAAAIVKESIRKAGRGGGFILADNHGEIPWQVSEETLLAISEAVRTYGNYPLDWIEDEG